MPHLKTLVERHKDDPFAVIGINCYDDEAAYKAGLEKFDLTWISGYHGEGANPVAELYQVQGFPTYYLLDEEGKIVDTGHSGSAFDGKIKAMVDKLKAKK